MALIKEEWISPSGRQLDELSSFLASVSLSPDKDIDYTVVFRQEEDGVIIAAGSKKGSLLKGIAVAEAYRHHHVLNPLMTSLYERMYAEGRTRWCGFTKPRNADVFRYEGLYPVMNTDHIVLLENRRLFAEETAGIREKEKGKEIRQVMRDYEDFRSKEPLRIWMPEEIPDYFIFPKEMSETYRREFSDMLSAHIVSCFLNGDELTERIGILIRRALREEVDTSPKPGLVDRIDSGSHTDMDPLLFSRSTFAVSPWLTAMFEEGRRSSDARAVFRKIRKLGMDAEKVMYEATGGVNTHKGMIFTMGILCASLGMAVSHGGEYTRETVLETAGNMVRADLERDFLEMAEREPVTHGEKLYREYGLRGVRGQAMDGFPLLKKVITEKDMPVNRQERDLRILLEIMSELEDTNILYRGTPSDLTYVRKQAGEILERDAEEWPDMLAEMNRECIRRGISPGGAADLLAAAIFLLDAVE